MLLGNVGALDRHAAFLAGMQDADGGFRATSAAPLPDLLSTSTALISLKMMGKLDPLKAARAAQFARTPRRGIQVLRHLDQLLLLREVEIHFKAARSVVIEDFLVGFLP